MNVVWSFAYRSSSDCIYSLSCNFSAVVSGWIWHVFLHNIVIRQQNVCGLCSGPKALLRLFCFVLVFFLQEFRRTTHIFVHIHFSLCFTHRSFMTLWLLEIIRTLLDNTVIEWSVCTFVVCVVKCAVSGKVCLYMCVCILSTRGRNGSVQNMDSPKTNLECISMRTLMYIDDKCNV